MEFVTRPESKQREKMFANMGKPAKFQKPKKPKDLATKMKEMLEKAVDEAKKEE